MDLETFTRLADEALAQHLRQPEMIWIYRALSTKHSDLGDFKKALEYITRAEKIADELFQTREHEQFVYIWLTKVEILLKKLTTGTEDEYIEPILIAKEATDLAKRIFGEKTFITN